jgi:hypothetical protein
VKHKAERSPKIGPKLFQDRPLSDGTRPIGLVRKCIRHCGRNLVHFPRRKKQSPLFSVILEAECSRLQENLLAESCTVHFCFSCVFGSGNCHSHIQTHLTNMECGDECLAESSPEDWVLVEKFCHGALVPTLSPTCRFDGSATRFRHWRIWGSSGEVKPRLDRCHFCWSAENCKGRKDVRLLGYIGREVESVGACGCSSPSGLAGVGEASRLKWSFRPVTLDDTTINTTYVEEGFEATTRSWVCASLISG